jgi:hypothetical protein
VATAVDAGTIKFSPSKPKRREEVSLHGVFFDRCGGSVEPREKPGMAMVFWSRDGAVEQALSRGEAAAML